MVTMGVLRREMRKAYKLLKNWELVGKAYGINRGMAWRIANERGYEPKDPKIRRRLGLSAMGQAPTCIHCGEVHVSRRCTKMKVERRYTSLFEMPASELRRRLVEREEV